jgi:hypothetical protein
MTTRSPLRTLAIALAAVAGIAAAGLAGPAAAQNSGSQQSAQQSEQQTPNYSDAKLESFAMAATKVRTVMQEYRPQLRQARQNQDRKQFEKVRMQARKAVEQKIAGTDGISTQEYQQIAQDARNDEQLRQKVLGMMKARQNQGQ